MSPSIKIQRNLIFLQIIISNRYELTVLEDCETYIELSSQETHSLCISMVESRGKRLTEFDIEMLSEINTNTLATSEMAFLRVSLQRDKKYLLIPSTAKPNQVLFFLENLLNF